MRRADSAPLTNEAQRQAADAGLKGMIPIKRPFLDYLLSALADAGLVDICLVIGPEHQRVRDYYGREVELQRVRIHFALQEEPLGTADAVLAAEQFAAGDNVLVLNSDNYYPVHTLVELAELGSAGVAGFERDTLIQLSNIDANKIATFAILEMDESDNLRRIIEKPGRDHALLMRSDVYVSMNSWSLPPSIYDACRKIKPSARGELELPSAIQFAIDDMNVRFRVLRFRDGVLDLSSRSDIATVAERLQDVTPLP